MISVLMTVGDMPAERRTPVLAALRSNLANPRIRDIHVMTEGDIGWMVEAAGAQAPRLHLHSVAARPTFAVLFGLGNSLLAAGAGTVALLNGDISITTAADAVRIQEVFDCLASEAAPEAAPVVLALSRHESDEVSDGGGLRIDLYDGSGLPNFLSADCWVFQVPVIVQRNLFYAPGQMNCDMFLAHDLISSGYRLFNPCLDIVITHHEPAKDDGFYQEKNREVGVQDLLERHITLNGISPFNYYGVPWTRIDWLRAGYRPGHTTTNGKRVMLAVPTGREGEFAGQIARLASLIERHDLEVHVICDGDVDRLLAENAGRIAALRRMIIVAPSGGLNAVQRGLLAGKHYSFTRLAFVGDLSSLTDEVLARCNGAFVGLGDTDLPAQLPIGCTLVTSVFRSDPFIRGFIKNSVALTGYDDLIDHIFLVSKLSETEVSALSDLLDRQPNVMVIWNRKDPGLYNCWNIGIRLSRRDYVSNANVDDLRDPRHVVTLIRDLEMHPEALVAATALNPFHDFPEDGTLPEDRPGWYADQAGSFGFFDLAHLSPNNPPRLVPHNLPHCMPVWRRSLHDRFGWFDEQEFGTFADWAFWLKVLQDGATGWMDGEALGFYFVNPTSHNRRGSDLEQRHRRVEEAFMPVFLARRDGQPNCLARTMPQVPRKLRLTGRGAYFGDHRNSFNHLIHALDPLDPGEGKGCLLIPFVERYFVWGKTSGEAGSASPAPITEDWIGILHVPFDAPVWFSEDVGPEKFLATPLWQKSLPSCRGIITLCADLEADLRAYQPGLPTLSVHHPTELNVRMFDFASYTARPRVVQIGDWLRKLQAIHRMRAPGHERVMLLKKWTEAYLDAEMRIFGDHRDPAVTLRTMVPNDEYDQILASSVVLCLMYATAANNVVVECIARATPLLVNPLPAVVEYLGPAYPLYARDEAEADLLLGDPALIHATHLYLLERRKEIDLSYPGFCRNVAASEFYARL